MCFFSAGLSFPLLVTSGYFLLPHLHIICHEFGGGIWEAVGGWVVLLRRCGGGMGRWGSKRGGGCRISLLIIFGMKRWLA